MVAAVATEEPEIAAKILQERIVAIAKPPGKFPTQACANQIDHPRCQLLIRYLTSLRTLEQQEV